MYASQINNAQSHILPCARGKEYTFSLSANGLLGLIPLQKSFDTNSNKYSFIAAKLCHLIRKTLNGQCDRVDQVDVITGLRYFSCYDREQLRQTTS